jgi:hypothetical protein
MRRHVMVLVVGAALSGWVSASVAAAQEFTLQVGQPIAGVAQPAKSSLLVVRPGGCANPASAEITATAEGIVDGARRSVPLRLNPLPTPGGRAVPKDWISAGAWIVSLTGTCAGKQAGAIVPVGPNATFRREAIKQLPHPPTADEIEASLKSLATGGQK